MFKKIMMAGLVVVLLGLVVFAIKSMCDINITIQSGMREEHVGGDVSMFVVVKGAGLTYQWRKGSEAVAGATTSTLILKKVALSDTGTYSCEVRGFFGKVVKSADITVNIYPVLLESGLEHPSGAVCPGSVIKLTVDAQGGKLPLTYAWFKDLEKKPLVDGPSAGGGVVVGAKTPILTITNAGVADSANRGYSCVVEDTGLLNTDIGSCGSR